MEPPSVLSNLIVEQSRKQTRDTTTQARAFSIQIWTPDLFKHPRLDDLPLRRGGEGAVNHGWRFPYAAGKLCVMNEYIVIVSSDGDVWTEELSREALEKRLSEDYYGSESFSKMLPRDLNERGGVWIIKGEVILPKPVDVVKSWSVE
jgi:hypothetical protein